MENLLQKTNFQMKNTKIIITQPANNFQSCMDWSKTQ